MLTVMVSHGISTVGTVPTLTGGYQLTDINWLWFLQVLFKFIH